MSLIEIFGREPSMTPEARTAEMHERAARAERRAGYVAAVFGVGPRKF